jgi:hypothetical protein
MRTLLAVVFSGICLVASGASPWSFSTDTTVRARGEAGSYELAVRISHFVKRHGKFEEQTIEWPKLKFSRGVPASLRCGLGPGYPKNGAVDIEISWPEVDAVGSAVCTISFRCGEQVMSRSRIEIAEGNK